MALASGFNLTLVECKSQYLNFGGIYNICFNLTLVECKYGATDPFIVDENGFNLTLVECKYRAGGLGGRA